MYVSIHIYNMQIFEKIQYMDSSNYSIKEEEDI